MNSPNNRPRTSGPLTRLLPNGRLIALLVTIFLLSALSFAAGKGFLGSGLAGTIGSLTAYFGSQPTITTLVPSTQQTVTPTNLNGWTSQTDTCEAPGVTAVPSFVSGPAPAPLGDGSYRMQVGTNGDSYVIARNPNFSGVRLDQLTTLSYSTFVTAYGSGGQAPYLSFNLDLNGDNEADDTIYFEPVYQDSTFFPSNPQGPLTLGTWQTWDALHGGWWSNNHMDVAGPGTAVKSIAQYLAAYPNARIMNTPSGGGLRVLAGCGGGAWANFDGNLDDLHIAYTAGDTTFDFDPNPPTVVTVRPESLNGWTTAEPVATTTAGGAVNFISDATAPSVYGAVQMTTDGTSTAKAQLMRAESIPLANITDLSYYTKQNSAPFNGAAPSFQIGVLLDGVGNFTTFAFEPYENGTVTNGNWQKWNVAAGQFWSSRTRAAGGACNVTAGAGGAPFYTLAALKANCPNAVVVQYGINIGSSNPSYDVEADQFRVNGTIYDFEPSQFKVVDDDGQASADDCDATTPASTTIAAAMSAANPGDTIKVCPGTYPTAATIAVNKPNITIIGATATKPVVQTSGTGYLFLVTGTGVTLDNLELQKTDLASPQNIIGIQANNFTAQNNLIYGPDPGGTWDTVGLTSRGFEVSPTYSGFLIQNNVIHTLRQPAYINPGTTGSVLNNNVSGTKGWVNDGGNIAFTGNTWGEPQNQSCDIALTSQVNPANYPSLTTLSLANDDAFVCAQFTGGENGRALAFVNNTPSFGNGSDNDNYTTIQEGVNGALTGGTVQVASGNYDEDVKINKTLTVTGAGSGSTTVSGPIGDPGSTFTITANNVDLSGFTITRDGNNTTDWNNPGLNSVGIAIQNQTITGAVIHDNVLTGNRTGIDINNSNSHTIRNNVIDSNRTGLIFRNQTDNLAVTENAITNNWTDGVLFLDASGGTNSPVQSAANCVFSNNNISGNWYGQIVDRQTGGSLPVPGANLKNFRGNWFGSASPVVTTADSAEPAYAVQIPVAYGGTASAPGGQPDIAGPASANFVTAPLLTSGIDTDVETVSGRGTFGFQGAPITINSLAPQGWVFFNETPNGSGSFVPGPAPAPIGLGSGRLTVDATGGEALGAQQFSGTRFADITTLRYSSYQNNASNPGPQAIALQFDVDSDLTDANTAYQGRLVFEPYQTPSNTVQQNVWQEWDTLAGRWWGSGSGASRPVSQACPQSNPCTRAQLLALFPNMGVHAATSPGVGIFDLKAGGGWAGGFDGNVDKLTIGINGADLTVNFDPPPPVTISGTISPSLSGVTVNLAGTQTGSTLTDGTGHYEFTGLPNGGDYLVTPAPGTYSFDPVSRSYSNVTADISNADFTGSTSPSTRVVRMLNGYTTPGQNVTIPVELVSQGDENSVGFSVNYDPSLVFNPVVSLGADASGATLLVNNGTSGQLGVAVVLPNPQVFAAGTRQVVTITFSTNLSAVSSTPLTFGNVPVIEKVGNANADPLQATFANAAVVFAQGLEADVITRNTGDSTLNVLDFQQVGRFTVGLDQVNPLFNEYQRADCAPRGVKGDGSLDVTDFAQAGRYAVGLDSPTTAGGPMTQLLFPFAASHSIIKKETLRPLAGRALNVVGGSAGPGQQVTVSVELDAQGDEASVGFSLSYDTAVLSNPVVALGSGMPGAFWVANTTTDAGRVGFNAVYLSQTIPAGTKQIATITFDINPLAAAGQTPVDLPGSPPTPNAMGDISANSIAATYNGGFVTILGPTAGRASVVGQVTDQNGRPLGGATVTLSDGSGPSRRSRTNQFGYFRFEGILAGRTYILNATAKGYTIPSGAVSLTGDVAGIVLVAQPK